MTAKKDVYIVSAVRTAIGDYGGSLKDGPAEALGATVIAEVIERGWLQPCAAGFKQKTECEIDGFGNALCMDDANVTSLLGMPYLETCSEPDSAYLATRRF